MAPDPQPPSSSSPAETSPQLGLDGNQGPDHSESSLSVEPGSGAAKRELGKEAGSKAETKTDTTTFLSVFLATFSTVFLAELGDKTQLAALLLSAESGRPVVVFFGASLALICSSLVGVLLGRWLARFIPAQLLERLAGILMVALGLWLGRQAVLSFLPSTDLPLGLAGLGPTGLPLGPLLGLVTLP